MAWWRLTSAGETVELKVKDHHQLHQQAPSLRFFLKESHKCSNFKYEFKAAQPPDKKD